MTGGKGGGKGSPSHGLKKKAGGRGCGEEETEGLGGTEAGAGDCRPTKVLEVCCDFKKRGGRDEGG